MNGNREHFVLSETTTIKSLLLRHPKALPVLLDRGIPVSCANSTIAAAARACGLAPEVLMADLAEALVQNTPASLTE